MERVEAQCVHIDFPMIPCKDSVLALVLAGVLAMVEIMREGDEVMRMYMQVSNL